LKIISYDLYDKHDDDCLLCLIETSGEWSIIKPRRQLVHKTAKMSEFWTKMNLLLFNNLFLCIVIESSVSPSHWKESKRALVKRTFLDKFQMYPNEVSALKTRLKCPNWTVQFIKIIENWVFLILSFLISVVWLNILSARKTCTVEILQSNAWYHGLAFEINHNYTTMYFLCKRVKLAAWP